MHWQLRIHEALWDSFENQQDSEIKVGSRTFPIEYEDTPYANRSKTKVFGTTYESQNMKKDSPNTTEIEMTPGHKISWAFKHGDGRINWQRKMIEYNKGPVKTLALVDLTVKPNKVIERTDETDEIQTK